MIYINHNKKAVFIHIPKTGGSYIGPTLTKYYGFISYLPILAYRRPDHDTICKTSMLNCVLTGNPLYDNSFFNKIVGILTYCKTSDYLNEKMNMDIDKWNSYTKFCFIRNPYSRAISGWKHFNIIFNREINIFDYLNITDPMNHITDIEYGHIFMSQKKQIEDENGLCGVDIIGRFEHLEEDFRWILNKIGFQQFIHPIVKVNVSNTEEDDNVRLEVQTIRKINELFSDDFDSFHYQIIPL